MIYYQLFQMRLGKEEAKYKGVEKAKELTGLLTVNRSCAFRHSVDRSGTTGARTSVTPTDINGLSLSKEEFRDGIAMRYGLVITYLPENCDGCAAKFSKQHGLSCKKGGLLVVRHNEVRDKLAYMATLAWNTGSVRDEPLINIVRGATTNLPCMALIQGNQTQPPTDTILPPHKDGRFFDPRRPPHLLLVREANGLHPRYQGL